MMKKFTWSFIIIFFSVYIFTMMGGCGDRSNTKVDMLSKIRVDSLGEMQLTWEERDKIIKDYLSDRISMDSLLSVYYIVIQDTIFIKSFVETHKQTDSSRTAGLLSLLYTSSNGVFENDSLAYLSAEKATKGNDPLGRAMLADYYINQRKEDDSKIKKALEMVRKLYDEKYAIGEYMLGILYYYGVGVEIDRSKALNLLINSAKKGYPDAYYSLGKVYYYGQETIKDYSKAFKYFTKGAYWGDSKSQHGLAMMYYDGMGVEPDTITAKLWLERAASQGYGVSNCHLGSSYYLGMRGYQRDYKKALYHYEKAGDELTSGQKRCLAMIYVSGEVNQDNFEKGVNLLKEFADKGFGDAQYKLGEIYEMGINVEPDDKEAFRWYKKAACNNVKEAMYRVGVFYDQGIVVAQNSRVAELWLKKAISKGDIEAKAYLENRK